MSWHGCVFGVSATGRGSLWVCVSRTVIPLWDTAGVCPFCLDHLTSGSDWEKPLTHCYRIQLYCKQVNLFYPQTSGGDLNVDSFLKVLMTLSANKCDMMILCSVRLWGHPSTCWSRSLWKSVDQPLMLAWWKSWLVCRLCFISKAAV